MAAYIKSLPKVSRVCVFCGHPPVEKNNEHVIPKWLLRLTGDEDRVAWFGLDFARGKPRRFAFDQFQFPACWDCNDRFAREVETPAQEVLVRLLEEGRITSRGAESLLDWLDKVRIGVWLGQRYLDRDLFGISPHFHITNRIRQKDRLVAIYRTTETLRSLTFAGWGTPAFQFTPGCLALRVNSYFFVNVSGDFLFSKRAGADYADDLKFLMVDGEARLTFEPRSGTGQLCVPILSLRELPGRSITFFQPIMPELLAKDGPERHAAKVGPLLAESRFGTWVTKPDEVLTLETADVPAGPLFDYVSAGVLVRQTWLQRNSEQLDAGLPEETRRAWRTRRDWASKVNTDFVQRFCQEKGIPVPQL